MDKIPFRQVHLDFHTSEHMPGVGSEFSEENFREALTLGHLSSITLFSKCHHGWSYHPTKVNAMHPTLNTDLLGRQLKVCEEMGVRTQIYISAGLDERKFNLYPQFRVNNLGRDNTLLGAHFHQLCLNNDEYLDMLCAETAEVMELYDGHFDGVFQDICTPTPCVCPACIETMLQLGLNPEDPADVEKHRDIVYNKYTKRICDTVARYNPDMPVFFNCGNIPRNDRSKAYSNTHHLELESLPTGGWGYDHFPLSAAYSRVLGREFVGMTGKFHKSWGEFGGYKHPNALIYETALSVANGAKCSIGDQLHPLGCFEPATYRLIGAAYAEIEKRERWCHDVTAVTDIGIFTTYQDRGNDLPDVGANRILLEGKYLYNIIDDQCNFEDYKLVIFPDVVEFDENLTAKVKAYLASGGKILLSGNSGLTKESGAAANQTFFTDFGVTYQGRSEIDASYLVPTYEMKPNGIAPYLMYERGHLIEVSEDVQVMAHMQDSYFNRSFRRFCSHRNTPNDPNSFMPGAVISGGIGYIAWNVFSEYGEHGAYHHKQIVCDMLDTLLGDSKTLTTTLPSNGIVTLMEQKEENRYVNHLLYAVTKLRGNTEVIEDAPVSINTQVSIKLPAAPSRVYLAPEEKDIAFSYENGVLSYAVDQFTLHGMVIIDK